MPDIRSDAHGFISDFAKRAIQKAKRGLEINIRERRATIEADLAARRARLLTAERMLAQLPAQAEALRAERDRLAAEPIFGPILDRNSVFDEGATASVGRNRRTIQAIDEVLADVPAALEYWKGQMKELAA